MTLEVDEKVRQMPTDPRAFVELISFMESCVKDGKYILTLSKLHQLYSDRPRDFGIEKEVNRTRLKLRILNQFS